MKEYLQSSDEVLAFLGADAKTGFGDAAAAEKLAKNGKNKLVQAKKASLLSRIFSQIADPMVLVLLGAAIISGVTSALAGESFADVFIILAVVVINTVLGVVQESKAEKAIDALKEMAAATSRVMRGGKIQTIKSEELVAGDIVLLEAGDAIPADGRILECASLKIEEAALTGESVPSEKTAQRLTAASNGDVPLGDRKNMCYMGSAVVYGRGKMVVTATGMQTEMGKIAHAISSVENGQTPLQKKLGQLSKILTVLVLALCAVMFVFSLLRGGKFDMPSVLNTFMLAVSLAVAAIPEGLAAVVTIVLSMGVTKMSKQNAIIRKLTAVETLGCTQIICSDKTGTLTQNKMTVVRHSGADESLLARALALCSDAALQNGAKEAIGEPTECALVNYAASLGLRKSEMEQTMPRVAEAPFDSMRKMMSTVHFNSGHFTQYTKGAPDELLQRCTMVLTDTGVLPLDDERRREILSENTAFAEKALRVLGCAYREYDEMPQDTAPQALEQDMIFLGLVGMIDPVRPEVRDAVARCAEAGIRPIMITGDHIDTAVAIAKDLGILKDPSAAITGAQIDEYDDAAFEQNVDRFSVYARVQPEHKVRIVNAWRKRGYVTAMTGDGVNDSPAIKSADIGIGMGITGTDVTKNVADMILADDNFATIVSAVAEGRRIYDNICKCIQFLLASNLSEVLSIFVATLFGFTILQPAQILFVNLVTDSLPALALGAEKAEPDIMKRPPRRSDEGIFSGGLGVHVFTQGIMISFLTLAAYFIGHFMEAGRFEIVQSTDGMTMAFLTMSMAEIFHAYNMRSRKSIFALHTHNFLLFGTMLLSLLLTAAVIYIPGLSALFGFAHISFFEYLTALGLAVLVIPFAELAKLFEKKRKKSA